MWLLGIGNLNVHSAKVIVSEYFVFWSLIDYMEAVHWLIPYLGYVSLPLNVFVSPC